MAESREPCSYRNCPATAERDWLLAQADDAVRDTLFAIRDIELSRTLDLEPIGLHPHGWIEAGTDRCGCSIWVGPARAS